MPVFVRLGAGVAILVAVLDQASKLWIADWLGPVGRSVPVTQFFNLVLVHNRGASFGLFASDSHWGPWLLSGFAVAILIGLVFWLFRVRVWWQALALGLIMGGALGNLIDRARLGAVIDFLDFHAAGYHWPAFNLADSAITVGVAIVLIDTLIGGETDRTVGEEPVDQK